MVWLLRRWDRRRRFRAVALQDPAASLLLKEVPRQRRDKSFHIVLPDGSVRSADEAIPWIFAALPGGAGLAWILRRFPGAGWVSRRVYGWLARNRHRWQRPRNEWDVALRHDPTQK